MDVPWTEALKNYVFNRPLSVSRHDRLFEICIPKCTLQARSVCVLFSEWHLRLSIRERVKFLLTNCGSKYCCRVSRQLDIWSLHNSQCPDNLISDRFTIAQYELQSPYELGNENLNINLTHMLNYNYTEQRPLLSKVSVSRSTPSMSRVVSKHTARQACTSPQIPTWD